MSRAARIPTLLLTALLLAPALALSLLAAAPAAYAHEERESQFPPGNGSVPKHRSIGQARDVLVVCTKDSGKRIRAAAGPEGPGVQPAPAPSVRPPQPPGGRRRGAQAAHEHLRAARAATARSRPGTPPARDDYDGGVVEYDLIVSCGEVVNLVTIAGDDPDDPDIICDNQLCDLQIEGTGVRPGDVTLSGGFGKDGDWVKHNGIKADRADGFYLANMTVELFRENAIYVHETDGYVLDRIETRNNDLYGVLTFTSDHGRDQPLQRPPQRRLRRSTRAPRPT